MSQNVTLQVRSQTGKAADGQATLSVVDPATRGGKAAAFAVAGIVGAAACIWIPIVHLITTWLFPLIGAVMAWKTWSTQAVFASATASCPECSHSLALVDKGANFPLRESCTSCSTQLEITAVD